MPTWPVFTRGGCWAGVRSGRSNVSAACALGVTPGSPLSPSLAALPGSTLVPATPCQGPLPAARVYAPTRRSDYRNQAVFLHFPPGAAPEGARASGKPLSAESRSFPRNLPGWNAGK